MKKITKEMIKSRLESIGMDKSIAEDLAEIEFRAEKINAANIDKGKELKKEKAQINKEQNIHMVLKKMIAAGLVSKLMDNHNPSSDIPEVVINTARISLSQLVHEDKKINFLPKEEWSDIVLEASKKYNDELIKQYNKDRGIEIDDKSHDEMMSKEEDIDELMYAYHEIIKDLEQEKSIDKSIMSKASGHMEVMNEFNKLIDKSDANFYQFADLFFAKRKIDNTKLEFAPDWFIEKHLKAEKPPIRTFFWQRFREKEITPITAYNTPALAIKDMESHSWFQNPWVSLLSFTSALLVIFMLYPVFTDKNNISPDIYAKYIVYKNPFELYRNIPENQKTKEDDLISYLDLREKKNIDSKMMRYVSNEFEKSFETRDIAKYEPPSGEERSFFKFPTDDYGEQPASETGDREFLIKSIEGIEIYKVDDQIALKQSDKKERNFRLFRNDQLVLSQNSTDFQSENLSLLVVDLSSTSGNYKIIISYKNENIFTKSFSIE